MRQGASFGYPRIAFESLLGVVGSLPNRITGRTLGAMADKELIIGLLERVRRRVRSERRFKTIYAVLSIALIVPLVLKVIDLITPLHGITVVVVLGLWATATIAWLVWSTRGQETLSQAADSLDRQARLQDQMKTAYWFMLHPPQPGAASEWIESQLQRTIRTAGTIQLETLYPGSIPKTFHRAFALIAVFVILNFLPQSQNHNWFFLQGAPPFQLSRTDQALAERAKKLLEKSEGSKELEKIIQDLEKGNISPDVAQQELSDLRQQIEGGNLELNNILDGLSAMANQLGQSSALVPTAQAMSAGEAAEAADEIRSLGEKLGSTPEDVLREMQKNLAQAAINSPASLQNLSKVMQQAADSIKNGDPEAEKAALENLAQSLDQLAQKMKGQQQQNQASQQLASLQNSLQQEAAGGSDDSSSEGATGQDAEGQNADASPNAPPASGKTPGSGRGTPSAGANSTANGGPQEEIKPADLTKLDVQLKMEALKGQAANGGQPQDIEEASKQERSAMDYRNVPSQLSPAQKDALTQNRLPLEQREIVKYYFEEIRPRANASPSK